LIAENLASSQGTRKWAENGTMAETRLLQISAVIAIAIGIAIFLRSRSLAEKWAHSGWPRSAAPLSYLRAIRTIACLLAAWGTVTLFPQIIPALHHLK
jgi:hypothetical protein